MSKKSFNEKLNSPGNLPKLVDMEDPRRIQRHGPGRMLVAAPKEYDDIMKRVPDVKWQEIPV